MIANVKGWQTDLKTGLIVPDTTFYDYNTLQNDLKYYLAYKIGTDASDHAMDNLFDVDGAMSGSHLSHDGIAHGSTSVNLDYAFHTTLNAGGDNSTLYIEFYGYIDGGPISLNNNLYLGQVVTGSTPYPFLYEYASYDINTSVAAGRRFHFYWRITIA